MVIKEHLLGGYNYKNLQSYVYILELKIEMFQRYIKDMTKIQDPLLREILSYENFVMNMLGHFGLRIADTGIMDQQQVLNQWDAYEAQHLGPAA